MDFFARQDESRRTTRYLLILFGLAFLAVGVATAVVLAILFGAFSAQQTTFSGSTPELLELIGPSARFIATATAVTMGLMILASLFRMATLSRGGGQVARMLGGTQISGDDPDPLHRRLMNVVEEMAIASGLPVPDVYVLENEEGINAFAAGLTHADAAIAVTRGSLERLDRAELQGVIGHEFSHILNGDMRLNLRLMGIAFGILVLSLVGRWLLRSSRMGFRPRSRGASVAVMIGLALAIVGGIGVLLSRLIKAAVSRQREVLADASSVQFTRDPLALAGALRKIGGYTTHLSSIEAEEVSHMLFGRASRGFRGWFATHPPIDDRIKALDPSFEPGDYLRSEAPLPERTAEPDSAQRGTAGISALAGGQAAGQPGARAVDVSAAGMMESSETGAAIREAIPEELDHAAHSADMCLLLTLAFAMGAEPATAERQIKLIELKLGAQRAAVCRRLRAELAELDRRLWLPLLELSMPALKRRPEQQVVFLFELLGELIATDPAVGLFEFTLSRTLRAYFSAIGIDLLPESANFRLDVEQAVYTLLATVAAFDEPDEAAARHAFDAGLARLTGSPRPAAETTFRSCMETRSLAALDAALEKLAGLSTRARRRTLEALEATIRHDGRVNATEAELFRAVAASLGCPMPPARAIG